MGEREFFETDSRKVNWENPDAAAFDIIREQIGYHDWPDAWAPHVNLESGVDNPGHIFGFYHRALEGVVVFATPNLGGEPGIHVDILEDDGSTRFHFVVPIVKFEMRGPFYDQVAMAWYFGLVEAMMALALAQ